MPLDDGQVSVGDLVLGAGTPYTVRNFNPWSRSARADQSGERAWGDGSWSGAEWAEQAVVPLQILTQAGSVDGWQAAHQALLAAFAPSHDDIELRWRFGTTEYLMVGRPRMVDPEVDLIGLGLAATRAAFVALGSTIYSGTEHQGTLGLPSLSGGLTFPITFPLVFTGVTAAGRAQIVNAGKKPTGLLLRIDGPVVEPRVSVLVGSTVQTLRAWLTLDADQWLDIDTSSHTAYLNGTSSRRGLVSGDWPTIPGGPAEIAFDAASYNPDALLTYRWRDAWY